MRSSAQDLHTTEHGARLHKEEKEDLAESNKRDVQACSAVMGGGNTKPLKHEQTNADGLMVSVG